MDSGGREASITLELADPVTIVHVRGELDLGTAQRFRSVLSQATHSGRCVVVDLRQCSFIDSVSIGLLLVARREAAGGIAEGEGRTVGDGDCEAPMAVVAGGVVAQTLELVGVGAELASVPVRSTVDDALTAVGASD